MRRKLPQKLSGRRRSSNHRLHSHPQQPKPDDDALLRVLLPLGGGGGGNDVKTLGEQPDGNSRGECDIAANSTKIVANLTKIEEIGYQHRAISEGASMKGASIGCLGGRLFRIPSIFLLGSLPVGLLMTTLGCGIPGL
nr:hypothetical protein Iba_chr15cCG7010 [Ipomoea batatas]